MQTKKGNIIVDGIRVDIDPPFRQEFEDLLKHSQKCCTTRPKKLGEVGDRFRKFGTTFEIVAVFRARLWRVAHDFHNAEGFYTTDKFIECWKKIHYRLGYERQKQRFFWVHIFFPVWEMSED